MASVGALTRALVRYGLYRANWWSNNNEEASFMLLALRRDPETPPVLRELADSHLLLFGEDSVDLGKVFRVLSQAAASQAKAGLHFFAGITQHNAMAVAMARARYRDALACGEKALLHLRDAGSAPHGIHATHSILAACYAELGYLQEAEESVALAMSSDVTDVDAFAEVAYYLAVVGDVTSAEAACRAAASAAREYPTERMQRTGLALARARTILASGASPRVEAELSGVEPAGVAARAAVLFVRALAAVAMNQHRVAAAFAFDGLRIAQAEGSKRWEARLRLVLAASTFDEKGILSAIHDMPGSGLLGVVDCADAIAAVAHLLPTTPQELGSSMSTFRSAWLPALRRRIHDGFSPAGYACARLLDQVGGVEDVPRLRAYERTYLRGSRAIGLGRGLSRRTASTLLIHDLGPGSFEVAGRSVQLTSIRRRAASLLAVLLTRPRATATREQVLDMLWPDLDPDAALNSLNQTLYFLRRDIAPDYDDDFSVNYIRLEGDLIWLDREMSTVDSVQFVDSASSAIGTRPVDIDRVAQAVRSYHGRFLPEFEYEDWSSAWRERLHGSFLHLVHVALVELADNRRHTEAIDLAHHALAVDPSSAELERALIWLYSSVGASTAAAEQYQHYAQTIRDELGADPPTLDELTGTALRHLRDD